VPAPGRWGGRRGYTCRYLGAGSCRIRCFGEVEDSTRFLKIRIMWGVGGLEDGRVYWSDNTSYTCAVREANTVQTLHVHSSKLCPEGKTPWGHLKARRPKWFLARGNRFLLRPRHTAAYWPTPAIGRIRLSPLCIHVFALYQPPAEGNGMQGCRGGKGEEAYEEEACDSGACPRLHYRLLTLCPAAY